jgi:hypothetical protein
MRAPNDTSTNRKSIPKSLRYFLGWLGVVVDALCILFILLLVGAFYQPNGGDVILILFVAAPVLLILMLVAALVAVACFRSLHRDHA